MDFWRQESFPFLQIPYTQATPEYSLCIPTDTGSHPRGDPNTSNSFYQEWRYGDAAQQPELKVLYLVAMAPVRSVSN